MSTETPTLFPFSIGLPSCYYSFRESNDSEEVRTETYKHIAYRNIAVFKPNSDIQKLFSKVHFGLGTEYMIDGNHRFMKECFEEKKPDLNGLPHIMTLIVTRDPKTLKVNGKNVSQHFKQRITKGYGSRSSEPDMTDTAVFVPLECSYEFLPSFTRFTIFPVYGVYQGLKAERCRGDGQIFHNHVLKILEDLDDDSKSDSDDESDSDDSDSDRSNITNLTGYFDCSQLYHLDVHLQKDEGERYPYPCLWCMGGKYLTFEPISLVEYTDRDQNQVKCKMTRDIDIPFARNLKIKIFSQREIIIEKMKECIIDHKRNTEKEWLTAIKLDRSQELAQVSELPDQPFMVPLEGIYKTYTSIEDLVKTDREMYNFLMSKNRHISVVPSTVVAFPFKYDNFVYTFENGEFKRGFARKSYDLFSIYIDRDDSYRDLCRMKGFFVVNM